MDATAADNCASIDYSLQQAVPSQRSRTSSAPPKPEAFLDGRCLCGREDVSDRVAGLLELFVACREQRYDDRVARAFLKQAEDFADWANAAEW